MGVVYGQLKPNIPENEDFVLGIASFAGSKRLYGQRFRAQGKAREGTYARSTDESGLGSPLRGGVDGCADDAGAGCSRGTGARRGQGAVRGWANGAGHRNGDGGGPPDGEDRRWRCLPGGDLCEY